MGGMDGGGFHNRVHQSSLSLLAPTQRPKEKRENAQRPEARDSRGNQLMPVASRGLGLSQTLQTSNRAPRPQEHPTCSTAPGTSTKAQAVPEGEVQYCLRQDSLCLGQTAVWPAEVCLSYWGGVCTWSTAQLGSMDDHCLETAGHCSQGGRGPGQGRRQTSLSVKSMLGRKMADWSPAHLAPQLPGAEVRQASL